MKFYCPQRYRFFFNQANISRRQTPIRVWGQPRLYGRKTVSPHDLVQKSGCAAHRNGAPHIVYYSLSEDSGRKHHRITFETEPALTIM